MSDYRFGDDYRLSIYPKDAIDCWGEIDMDKVEAVEIDFVDFIRKPDDKSRWHELFSTPERAARTLLRVDSSCCNYEVDGIKQSCVTCPLNMNGLGYPKMRCYAYVNGKHDELLEWLRGDA
jgi:hypothetical protein